MATVGKWHEKQPKFDKNRNFDPLGVEIELWAINPKRCARLTYGGLGVVKIPKFPKIVFEGFFTLSCKKNAQKFCTKNFSSQEKFL